MNRELAAQALSACDRLESGVNAGEAESIAQARRLLSKFARSSGDNVSKNMLLAVRMMMLDMSKGDIRDLQMALCAVRKLCEQVLSKGEEDGENSEG